MASSFLQAVSTGRHAKCPGSAETLEATNQVFSYERQFSRLKLGQIVNIVDESQYDKGEDGGRDGSGGLLAGDTTGPGVQVTFLRVVEWLTPTINF